MLIAQLSTPILAAASPEAGQIGAGVLFLLVLCPLLGLVTSIIFGVISARAAGRRNPPVAEEMHKVFLPRAEHDVDILRIHERIDKCTEDNIASRNQFAKAFGDLEHAIGRLEGRMDRDERIKPRP